MRAGAATASSAQALAQTAISRVLAALTVVRPASLPATAVCGPVAKHLHCAGGPRRCKQHRHGVHEPDARQQLQRLHRPRVPVHRLHGREATWPGGCALPVATAHRPAWPRAPSKQILSRAGNAVAGAVDAITSSGAGLSYILDVRFQMSPAVVARLTGTARRVAVHNAQQTGALYASVRCWAAPRRDAGWPDLL